MSDLTDHRPAPEYSEPTMTRHGDGTVTVAWPIKGTRAATLVSDELVEQWVATINELAELRRRLPDTDLFQRAASASRNACQDAWFSWVPEMLERLARSVGVHPVTRPVGDAT